jgi:hypothetical protein
LISGPAYELGLPLLNQQAFSGCFGRSSDLGRTSSYLQGCVPYLIFFTFIFSVPQSLASINVCNAKILWLIEATIIIQVMISLYPEMPLLTLRCRQKQEANQPISNRANR